MKLPFRNYVQIDRNIWYLILSEAAIQVVNGCLMLILLLYLHTKGYTDGESARFTAARFLGVLLISFPLGMYIKKRKLIGFFRIASISLPLFTLLALWMIEEGYVFFIYLSFFLWGISFSFAEICKLPFILRQSESSYLSAAIALSYATWSFGAVLAGILIYLFSTISPTFFDERNCIIAISLLSLLGSVFTFKMKELKVPDTHEEVNFTTNQSAYDWKKIVYALTPTFIIAIGAGMSIPFVPLFFQYTFSMDYKAFAGYGFLAYLLVFIMTLLTPDIKNKLGYKIAIPLTQTLSVTCLVIMGVTELLPTSNSIFALAIAMYMLRQPLMNLAQPMTTEIIMKYVGKSNHEMVSALMALIWNGSFVVTSLLFAQLRDWNINFFFIFLLTAILYAIAIIWYVILIRQYEKSIV
jgi:hypothetical protein